MTAELCRQTDARSFPLAAKLAPCAPVLRLPATPGPSVAIDTLPPALQSGPVELLTYHIQIFNAAGHSAWNSTTVAYTASGPAPHPVEALQATASEQGAVLEWNSTAAATGPADLIDLKRFDLSPPLSAQKQPKPTPIQPRRKGASSQSRESPDEAPGVVHLRASDAPSGTRPDTAGTVDTTAAMGNTYTYSAQRVREVVIDNRKLEVASDPSAPVTLALRDTFPPKPPTGLETISGSAVAKGAGASRQPYVDLSWEPNPEPDLAGYRVYRQLARPDGSPQGPLGRLTALPITVPAYRDVAVKAGQGYIYSVTAVDAAGNESAPSAKAIEFVSGVVPNVAPDVEQSPH